jgi:signal transduction histidine kinase
MFIVAVAVTGLYVGVRPALLATVLGAVVADIFFVEPRYHLTVAGLRNIAAFAVYLLAAVAVVLLTHARRRAAARAELSLKRQVEAERKLLNAEMLFRQFMDNSSACAYLRDEEGQCIYANKVARREFGVATHSRQAVISSDFRQQNQDVLNTGQPKEFVDRTADERYWLTSKFPFVDQSGRKFVGGISFEITDRIRAEEILRKTERLSAAGQMASLLAHEISNPLAVLTNVMFLVNQQPLASPAREFVSQAGDALARINRIVHMTLGLYVEKDAPAPVHVCQVIHEVLDMLATTENFRAVGIKRELNGDVIVLASPRRLQQVMVNLLTNAVESSAQTVRVRVRKGLDWRRRRAGVRITVADDGRGIRPELSSKIFEPFFSTKAESGTGLGLWASRAIVLKNEGAIRVRSAVSGPRKGTYVSVFLPATTELGVSNRTPVRVFSESTVEAT